MLSKYLLSVSLVNKSAGVPEFTSLPTLVSALVRAYAPLCYFDSLKSKKLPQLVDAKRGRHGSAMLDPRTAFSSSCTLQELHLPEVERFEMGRD